jgi:hypothetical protein
MTTTTTAPGSALLSGKTAIVHGGGGAIGALDAAAVDAHAESVAARFMIRQGRGVILALFKPEIESPRADLRGDAREVPRGLRRGACPEPVGVPPGEHVILLWYGHTSGEAVRCLIRSELQDARVSRLRIYYFSPELLTDVAGELGGPVRTNGRAVD